MTTIDDYRYALRLALGLLALWRPRPGGVARIEGELLEVEAGVRTLTPDDARRLAQEINHLDKVRDAGPFIAPVDRSDLPVVAPVVGA